MNTSQLLCCIHCDPVLKRRCLGVFAANRIPQHIDQGAVIVNSDPDGQPGTHWCSMYFIGNGTAEYFDSYGGSPQNSYFKRALKNNSKSFVYNAVKLQNNVSNVCGQFCLYYLMRRLRGDSLKDIVKSLDYYPNNDHLVYRFVEEHFPCCTDRYPCSYKQSCKAL